MEELIANGPDHPRALYEAVVEQLQGILDRKRSIVAWKLEATRAAFDADIRPQLERRRAEEPKLLDPWTPGGLDVEDTAPSP
jgi:hypothetical protein